MEGKDAGKFNVGKGCWEREWREWMMKNGIVDKKPEKWNG